MRERKGRDERTKQGKPGGLRAQGECVFGPGELKCKPYCVFKFVAVESKWERKCIGESPTRFPRGLLATTSDKSHISKQKYV